MDRRVVDLLKSMPERNRFVRGIRSWTPASGFIFRAARPPRGKVEAHGDLRRHR
jgi:dolichol-phosphate mannosyltransferase